MTAILRKAVLLLLSAFLMYSGINAQSVSENEKLLINSAEKYLLLAKNQNWIEFVEASHPGYVHYFGGTTRLVRLLEGSENSSQVNNSVSLLYQSKGENPQAVLSFLSAEGKRNFLLAASADKGKSWSYFLLPHYLADNLLHIMPDASEKIPAVINSGYLVENTNKGN